MTPIPTSDDTAICRMRRWLLCWRKYTAIGGIAEKKKATEGFGDRLYTHQVSESTIKTGQDSEWQ